MITAYHRPQTMDEVLSLMTRPSVHSVLAGGGTTINRLSSELIEVIDLQALKLNQIEHSGNLISLGATLSLHTLMDAEDLPAALRSAIKHETSFNLRQVGTLAGALVACDGRSPFAAAMLALDAQLTLISAISYETTSMSLGELLPLRQPRLQNRLITQATIPSNAKLEIEMVGRTPADWPVCGVCAARWPSGRTRITLMGFGDLPILALDGPEPGGAAEAVKFAFGSAGDEWATAEYRQAVAAVQVERVLSRMGE